MYAMVRTTHLANGKILAIRTKRNARRRFDPLLRSPCPPSTTRRLKVRRCRCAQRRTRCSHIPREHRRPPPQIRVPGRCARLINTRARIQRHSSRSRPVEPLRKPQCLIEGRKHGCRACCKGQRIARWQGINRIRRARRGADNMSQGQSGVVLA